MIIFLDSDAKIRAQHDGNVGRGSSASWIYIVAPISASNAYISFTLPNGDYTDEVIATQEVGATDLGLVLPGTGLRCWSYKLEKAITQYSGTVSYTVRFTFADGSELASDLGSFNVSRGNPSLLPDQPKEDVYNVIKAYLENVSEANNELDERVEDLEEKTVDFDVLCANIEEALSESGFKGDKGDKGDKGEKGDKGGGCGITTSGGGEIFNDYTNNKATKNFSTVRGKNNACDGVNAVVGGANSYASANNSFTHGENLRNTHLNNTVVVGRHNEEKTNSVFEVGYGYDNDNKYNAFEVIRSQQASETNKKNAAFKATVYQNGVYRALATEKYVDNKVNTDSDVAKTYLAGYTGGKFHISQKGVAEIKNANTNPVLNMSGGYQANGTQFIDGDRNLKNIVSINETPVSNFAKSATGTYTGNDGSGVTLNFGFKPLIVVVKEMLGAAGDLPGVTTMENTRGETCNAWMHGFVWYGQNYIWVMDVTYFDQAGCVDFEPFDTGLKFGSYEFVSEEFSFMGEEKVLNAAGVTYEYFAIGY